jgi:hypothetical protein
MLTTQKDFAMRQLLVLAVMASVIMPVNAAEYRCNTYCPYWNQCFSRCAWFYSEQEQYELNQNRALQNLYRDTDGGRRRPSRAACIAAIESGVANGTYGCND